VACGKPTSAGEDFDGPCVHDSDIACALWQRDEARAALAEAEALLAQRGHWLVKALDERSEALAALAEAEGDLARQGNAVVAALEEREQARSERDDDVRTLQTHIGVLRESARTNGTTALRLQNQVALLRDALGALYQECRCRHEEMDAVNQAAYRALRVTEST
jgi:hypothetical protein